MLFVRHETPNNVIKNDNEDNKKPSDAALRKIWKIEKEKRLRLIEMDLLHIAKKKEEEELNEKLMAEAKRE